MFKDALMIPDANKADKTSEQLGETPSKIK